MLIARINKLNTYMMPSLYFFAFYTTSFSLLNTYSLEFPNDPTKAKLLNQFGVIRYFGGAVPTLFLLTLLLTILSSLCFKVQKVGNKDGKKDKVQEGVNDIFLVLNGILGFLCFICYLGVLFVIGKLLYEYFADVSYFEPNSALWKQI